jgi:DNA-binding NtrC family response regulator
MEPTDSSPTAVTSSKPADLTVQNTLVDLPVRSAVVSTADGKKLRVTTSPVTVGRSDQCDLTLKEADVSAIHAELVVVREGLIIRDVGSKNGTWVNGVRCERGAIHQNAVLKLGSAQLTVTFERAQLVPAALTSFGPLVGVSESMRMVFRSLAEVAPTNLSVLVTGETGTGKELVAQAIHEASSRKSKSLVVLDCTTIPPSLAESTLFGHEKGSFTGANERASGVFTEADGGTLFLDELGELPPEQQSKLLRVLAEGKLRRVGATKYEDVSVRLICATLRDLGQQINSGSFRQDLFFRIAQVRIRLPPLRERLDDIPVLVKWVCEREKKSDRLQEVMELLQRSFVGYAWPGNVRELVSMVRALVQLPPSATVLDSLLERRQEAATPRLSSSEEASPFVAAKAQAVATFERGYFEALARACEGNVSEMSRRSGLARHHVRGYLRKYALTGSSSVA